MNKLKSLRGQLGYTQEELAQQVGMTRDTYKNYEQQRTEMGYDMLIKFADYFGCSIDYLLGHQTANTLQLDGLSDRQKQVVNQVCNLNDDQVLMLIGYIARIQERPITEVIEQIKKSN